MNLLYTNNDPLLCAHEHCKVHVNKMITEYTQLLSTTKRINEGKPRSVIYKDVWREYLIIKEDKIVNDHLVKPACMMNVSENHPTGLWVQESSQHYQWVVTCLTELHKLYKSNKGIHQNSIRYFDFLSPTPNGLEDNKFRDPNLAINPVLYPEVIRYWEKCKDVPLTYQYYMCQKFREWLYRKDKRQMIPEWYGTPPDWIHKF